MKIVAVASLLASTLAITSSEVTGAVLDSSTESVSSLTAEVSMDGSISVQDNASNDMAAIVETGIVDSASTDVVFENANDPTALVQTEGIMKGIVGVAGAAVSIASGGTAGLIGLAQGMLSLAAKRYIPMLDDEYPYACKCSEIFPTQCKTPDDTESIYLCINTGSAASTSLIGGAVATAALAAYAMRH